MQSWSCCSFRRLPPSPRNWFGIDFAAPTALASLRKRISLRSLARTRTWFGRRLCLRGFHLPYSARTASSSPASTARSWSRFPLIGRPGGFSGAARLSASAPASCARPTTLPRPVRRPTARTCSRSFRISAWPRTAQTATSFGACPWALQYPDGIGSIAGLRGRQDHSSLRL